MGCDIHGWVEVKHDDKWIAVKELKDDDRCYARFAMLAGVRDYEGTSKMIPLGVPSDVSETAKYFIEQFDTDGHSHSYMPLSEAAQIFLEASEKEEHQREYTIPAFFGIYDDDYEGELRLVFWFDN